jgi:hypothetical protein
MLSTFYACWDLHYNRDILICEWEELDGYELSAPMLMISIIVANKLERTNLSAVSDVY